ncbi:hypothetical protein M7I_0835 [Glarea lozoyensis 74030]|uniref:Uncharacterized protein n=1 Tax=Glarea lozoyensis (strain ATCC 74030 / MF5533) TaxID=1104152 RepID=H0EEG0_GLAL7|nr:hypothetical protein M7I_0835 [Glarea lozoyensis 74030]
MHVTSGPKATVAFSGVQLMAVVNGVCLEVRVWRRVEVVGCICCVGGEEEI